MINPTVKKRLIKRMVGLVAAVAIFSLVQPQFSKTTTKKDLEEYGRKCESYAHTEGILDEEYSQLSLSKRSQKLNINTFHYNYEVQGNKYQANKTSLKDVPTEMAIQVWYDKTDPQLNETEDPCTRYQQLKSKKVSAFSGYYLYSLIACAGIALYCLVSIVKSLVLLGIESFSKKISPHK